MRTGIEVTAPLAGHVAEYDQREAARFALLSWPAYQRLSQHEQARTVAHYMAYNLIQAHSNDALNQEYDRRSGKARHR